MADKPRVEYLMSPGTEHHPYAYLPKGESQTRYWWRRAFVDERDPVTVDELMTALGSVMPNKRRRMSLQSLLSESLSEEVPVSNSDEATAQVITQRVGGSLYEMSPSDVETIVSVLTTLHDTGIDYDVQRSNDGSINLKVNDNTGSLITLVDPVHPYLTGQVRTRDGAYWSPELTRLPFATAAEAAQGIEPSHAIAVAVRKDGQEVSPYATTTTGDKNFMYSERKMERFYARGEDFDVPRSQLQARVRYAGLDQETKNRLALSGLVNLLGIDRTTLSAVGQKTVPEAKVETINRLKSGFAYQAQLNLGIHDATIAPVDIVEASTGDVPVTTRYNDPLAGNIQLDLRSGIMGDDRVSNVSTNPSVDPYQVSPDDANELINVAYRDARISRLKELIGPSQDGQDDDVAKAQGRFKRDLANVVKVPTLGDDGRTVTMQPLAPLSLDDQQAILTHFKNGIFGALADKHAVDDTALTTARNTLNQDVFDPVLKARRLQAFDALTAEMSDTFGAAPVINSPIASSVLTVSPDEYLADFKAQTGLDSTQATRITGLTGLNKSMQQLLLDHPETISDLDQATVADALNKMPYNEQFARLDLIKDMPAKKLAQSAFLTANQSLRQDYDPHQAIYLSTVIDKTEDGANSTMYGFMMAQAVAKTKYAKLVAGHNDYASDMVQERAVSFDDQNARRLAAYMTSVQAGEHVQAEDQKSAAVLDQSSAMTISQLRAADADPQSDEAKLRQYMQDVASGKKTFSFDPNENPYPAAFNHDGTKLIRDMSPNEFKAQALEVVKKRLEARGAIVKDSDIKIDAHGVVQFNAQIPLYRAATHEQQRGGATYKSYDAATARPGQTESHGLLVTDKGRVYRDDSQTDSNELRYQPISGTFGQIFAPDHDGLIRTAYNRFDGKSVSTGQFVYQARYRGWIANPDRDASGNWSKDAFRAEEQNGLGQYNRLHVMGYDQALYREVGQATDSLVATRDVGDISRYNSNTIMNKLLHNEVLGSRVETNTLSDTVTPMSQAERETELNAVRMEDAMLDAAKTTEVISYMTAFNQKLAEMRQNGDLTNPDDPEETKLDVIRALHNPISVYGGHGAGEVANASGNYFFSDNMTGQGKMFGLLMYMVDGTEVLPNGKVVPNLYRDKDGQPIKDATGKYVGLASGTPLENMSFFDDSLKNAGDRQPVSKEQAIKGFATLDDAHIATMGTGGYTMEDGLTISKAFAETHQISDETADDGTPIMRPLKIGDKISDNGGNKATISTVVDPDMAPADAEKAGMLDIVQFYKQHPDLQVTMNGMSQISRNNGATAYTYLTNDSHKMSFVRYAASDLDEHGNPLPDATGKVVPVNATLNTGKLILTNQTINHKVTLYNEPGNARGRKLSILLNNADNAKGAHIVGNWHRRDGQNLQTLRQTMLAMGVDLLPDKVSVADYDEIAKQTSIAEYAISEDNQRKIMRGYDGLIEKKAKANSPRIFTARGRNATSVAKSAMFDGLDNDGELTPASRRFLSTFQSLADRKGTIAANTELMAPDRYDAGADFLQQLPDGGVLKLPDGVQVHLGSSDKAVSELYILPERLRVNTTSMDGTIVQSDFNRYYQTLGTSLAKYQALVKATKDANLANGSDLIQAKINEQLASRLNIQGSVNRIVREADQFAFGGSSPKNGFFRNFVLGGYAKDSVTSQVSANPMLPMDVIEISPQIAQRLKFVTGADGMAHVDGHDDWGYLHVHRDPVWREQGSLGFRVKINPELTGVRISPVMASLMDADFDGDNLGLTLMDSADAQKELRDVVSVDHWMLDNAGKSSLLNINAELVDMAVNTSNNFTVTSRDGRKITGNFLNPDFRREALQNMRTDVVPADVFDADGQPVVNDGDFLGMIVDNEIKTHYDQHDYVGARQAVDEIVQRARGFETSRDKSGEVQVQAGPVSMLANDGVDYTSEATLRQSLMKFVNEGAKGKPEAVDGLIDGYMKKPLFSEVKAMGEAQVKNGVLDTSAHDKYVAQLDSLHDTLLAVQRATKIKSDMTGIPGSMQQKLTAVMMNSDDMGMHTAASIGQAGTQKILSIKRDPIMAGRVSELMQEPLGALLRGQFPNHAYPTFALLGAEAQGRLGNDPSTAALRASKLRAYKVPGLNVSLRDFPGGAASDQFTTDQTVALGNYLGIKLNPDNTDQISAFKTTVDEATQPYLRDDFVKDLKQTVATAYDRDLDEVSIPVISSDDPSGRKPDGITKTEFVEVMDYFYNGHANGKTYPNAGMGLGVDRSNFERLADQLVDKQDPSEQIRSIEDATKENGYASFASKVNMHGVSAINDELNAQQQANYQPQSLFGETGSYVRDSVFGGLSEDALSRQLDLQSLQNDLSQPVNQEVVEGQDQLLHQTYNDLLSDVSHDAIADTQSGLSRQQQIAASSLAALKEKTSVAMTAMADKTDGKTQASDQQATVDKSGRYGIVTDESAKIVGFNGRFTPLSPDYVKPFVVQLSVADKTTGLSAQDNQPRQFSSVNQFVGFAKAAVAGDNQHAAEILNLDMADRNSAYTLDDEISQISGVDDAAWHKVLPTVMKQATFAKFKQIPACQVALLATGDSTLVYANGESDANALAGCSSTLATLQDNATDNKVVGQNLTGQVLSEVRSDLSQGKVEPTPTRVAVQDVTKSKPVEPKPTKPVVSIPATIQSMVDGNYTGAVSVNGVSGLTVNGQVAMEAVQRSQQVVSADTTARVKLSQRNAQKYADTFMTSVSDLANEYQQATGASLFTETSNKQNFANAYYVQMVGHPEVAKALKSPVGQTAISKITNPARKQGLAAAISFYDKQQGKQASTPTPKSPKTPDRSDDGLSR